MLNETERKRLIQLSRQQILNDLRPEEVHELQDLKDRKDPWPPVDDPSLIIGAAAIQEAHAIIAPPRVQIMIYLHLLAGVASNAGIPIPEIAEQLEKVLQRQEEAVMRHKGLPECDVPGCQYHPKLPQLPAGTRMV